MERPITGAVHDLLDCRLDAQIHSTDHVQLSTVIAENQELKDQVQELTNQIGELTMGQPNK